MLFNYRGGRTSPSTCLFVGALLVFVCILFFGRPYAHSIQAQLPVVKEKISNTIGNIHLPGAGSSHTSPDKSSDSAQKPTPSGAAAVKLWSKLQPLLDDHGPKTDKIPGAEGIDFRSFEWEHPSSNYAENILDVKMTDVVQMRNGHRAFVEGMKKQFADFEPGKDGVKRGIITTAADWYLPVFVVSLRMLRRTGSDLPVEVWMNTRQEYEPEICEEVLPTLNARCRMLADVLEKAETHEMKSKIEHFQFKIFAILFSDYQEVLWLDADNFPLVKPDDLFESELYKTNGMVIWPDFWYRTVSPTYHLINDGEPEHRGVRPAAETGQMLWNKASHFDVLLLSAYYNYYGPGWYYELTCQNGPGQGDKETFIPAAQTLGKPFYQVHTPVKAIGHERSDKHGIVIFAMIQYDPVQDFYLFSNVSTTHNNSTPPTKPANFNESATPQPFFLHANTPKWNPKDIFNHPKADSYDLTWDTDRNPSAAGFTDPPEVVAELNGVERYMWEEVRWVACNLEGKFQNWKGDDQVCNRVKHYFETHLDKAPPGTWPPPVPPKRVKGTTSGKGSSGQKHKDKEEDSNNDEHLVMSDDGEISSSEEEEDKR